MQIISFFKGGGGSNFSNKYMGIVIYGPRHARENLSLLVCEKHRPTPACASAQSDQGL